ncbi:FIG00469922: hypothetical protein [hydrothermal vent metagenome]|uniref:Prepilin-type N-terminal cleavage/methylation domain-containing protein n=1 Tax=hydrothermal vent metagenome TaxID=652676 RepID=A0A1W1BW82_9ZZZZ
MRLSRRGFTFIEMIFVIVILGIIAKYGVEFLAQAYRNYLYEEIINKLANESSNAVELIAKRLQYRIRSSAIVRKGDSDDFRALEGFSSTGSSAEDYNVLEWIGYDIEGFRGDENATPNWSGIIDKEAFMDDHTYIISPDSNLDEANNTIYALSNGNSSIADAALYLFSAENDINSSFGWYGGDTIDDQSLKYAMHPIKEHNETAFESNLGDFNPLYDDIKAKGEWDARYYLAWSAYAVSLEDHDLKFYYDYQPWQGEKFSDGKSALIMSNVTTFKMIQKEGVIKIQVCVSNDMNGSGTMNIGGFALCKEKTIY